MSYCVSIGRKQIRKRQSFMQYYRNGTSLKGKLLFFASAKEKNVATIQLYIYQKQIFNECDQTPQHVALNTIEIRWDSVKTKRSVFSNLVAGVNLPSSVENLLFCSPS